VYGRASLTKCSTIAERLNGTQRWLEVLFPGIVSVATAPLICFSEVEAEVCRTFFRRYNHRGTVSFQQAEYVSPQENVAVSFLEDVAAGRRGATHTPAIEFD
jgi:hypothetical protein